MFYQRKKLWICAAIDICGCRDWGVLFPSIGNKEEALQMITEKELNKDSWNEISSEIRQKENIVKMLAYDVGIGHRLNQSPSDVCNTRKRAARDCLLESLGYSSSFSRSSLQQLSRFLERGKR